MNESSSADDCLPCACRELPFATYSTPYRSNQAKFKSYKSISSPASATTTSSASSTRLAPALKARSRLPPGIERWDGGHVYGGFRSPVVDAPNIEQFSLSARNDNDLHSDLLVKAPFFEQDQEIERHNDYWHPNLSAEGSASNQDQNIYDIYENELASSNAKKYSRSATSAATSSAATSRWQQYQPLQQQSFEIYSGTEPAPAPHKYEDSQQHEIPGSFTTLWNSQLRSSMSPASHTPNLPSFLDPTPKIKGKRIRTRIAATAVFQRFFVICIF